MRIAFLLLLSVLACQAEQFGRGWWHGRYVTYKIRDGLAIYHGDIILGKAADIPQGPVVLEPSAIPGKSQQAEAIHPDNALFTGINNQYLWPNGVVPYTIDPAFTGKSLSGINQAIQFYNTNTPVKWTPRTSEANYVAFTPKLPAGDCSGEANEGMAGGRQEVDVSADSSCGVNLGTVEHEMGHAIGLEHEQTRFDRDYYVHVNLQNIDKNNIVQFQPDLGQIDLLPYNQGSIMHYAIETYQRNNLTTIDTIPLGIPVSERNNLSAGDIEAIRTAYGTPSATTTVWTNPPQLQVIVDGQSVKAPVTFNWAPGSSHTLAVADGPQQTVASMRNVFARWSNDGPQTQTITVTPETRVICANFSTQYLMVASVGKSGGGTVTVNPSSPDGYYTQGTLLTVTATPAAGYTFLQWFSNISQWHGLSSSPASFVLDAPGYAYTAEFTKSPVTTITTAIAGTYVTVDGQSLNLPASVAWTAGSKHTLDVPTPMQDAGYIGSPYRYTFKGWGDGGAISHTITAGASSTTLAANWQQEWLVSTYTVDPNYSDSGTLAVSPASNDCGYPTPTDCYYPAGTQLTFTPAAKAPFVFTGWSNDLSGNVVPGSITLNDQVYLTANFAQPGRLTLTGIVNAASYDNLGVSPGELVTIFGLQFGPAAQLIGAQLNGNTLATTLAGTQVLFDGRAAPLIYVSANQISAIVPYEVTGQTTTRMVISYQGKRGNAVGMPVLPTHPGLFTLDSSGSGLVVALNQDNSLHGVNNPAARGTVLQLYGTGFGVTSPASQDGQLVGASLPLPTAPVKVLIAGRNAQVQYFGGAPGLASGIFQANVVIPTNCPTGLVPISVTVGGYSSPGTTRVSVK